MSFLSLVIPYLTVLFRVLLLLPCFSVFLYRIRRGWECCKNKSQKDEESTELGVTYATVNKGVDNLQFQPEVTTVSIGASENQDQKVRVNGVDHAGYEQVDLPDATERL